jgi:hypothetical protein
MKHIRLSLITIFLLAAAFLSYSNDDFKCRRIELEYKKYDSLHINAKKLLGVSSAFMLAGTLLLPPAMISNDYWPFPFLCTTAYSIGFPLAIAGGIMAKIAVKNKKTLKNSSCLQIKPNGLKLSLMF